MPSSQQKIAISVPSGDHRGASATSSNSWVAWLPSGFTL